MSGRNGSSMANSVTFATISILEEFANVDLDEEIGDNEKDDIEASKSAEFLLLSFRKVFCECFISSFVNSSLLCHKTKVSTVLCKRCER